MSEVQVGFFFGGGGAVSVCARTFFSSSTGFDLRKTGCFFGQLDDGSQGFSLEIISCH